jgi:uncharacterized protein YyaL (SSP411 family)
VLEEPRYLQAAEEAADFILKSMRRPNGRLLHSWRNGQAKFDAYLDDYACLGNALMTLYEATFDEHWIDEAVRLADVILAHFADAAGGFFFTSDDHEQLIARHKDAHDSSVPSGNAMAATMLLRLGKLCGRTDFLSAAEKTLQTFVDWMEKSPTATGQMLLALDMQLGPTPELVILGDDGDTRAVMTALHQRFWPNKVVAKRRGEGESSALAGIFEGKASASSGPTLYVCENFACQEPVRGKEAILAAFDKAK